MYVSKVKIYNDAGALQQTVTLPTVTSYGLNIRTFVISTRTISAATHEVVFYSGITDSTPASDVGSATIYAYDITAGAALSSVVVKSRVSSGRLAQVDSLTALSDGSIVSAWSETDTQTGRAWSTRETIRVYNTSNAETVSSALATQDTYGYGFFSDNISASTVYLSSPAPTGFWHVRQVTLDTSGGTATVARTATIDQPIGITDVLPFFLTGLERFAVTVDPSPGPFTGEPPVRWLRRTPHTIENGERTFFGKTELLVDVGSGGTSNTATQRYSNDGAKTWSASQTQTLGIAGASSQRVLWVQNGSARDRVWEWYGDGDAPARLVDCFVDVGKGSS